jgi:nucleoside-diphosphate-sugar epimerase
MTRVLLFGAAGFLGRPVRDAFTAAGGHVVCPTRSQCDLVRIDVAALADLVRASRPDAVVNCTGLLDGCAADLMAANATVTAKLIDAVAAGAPAARFVRIGSAAEYGPVPVGQAVTEPECYGPAGAYGESHLTGTRLVQRAVAAGHLDGVVLRVFNPLGPGQGSANLLGRARTLLHDAVAAQAARVTLGPLDPVRDFVDVRDVATAVRAAATAPDLTARVFNVASGRAVPVRTAVRLLADAAGFTGTLHEDATAGGTSRSSGVTWMCGDPSLARRLLGWSAGYPLAESVATIWAGRDGHGQDGHGQDGHGQDGYGRDGSRRGPVHQRAMEE